LLKSKLNIKSYEVKGSWRLTHYSHINCHITVAKKERKKVPEKQTKAGSKNNQHHVMTQKYYRCICVLLGNFNV